MRGAATLGHDPHLHKGARTRTQRGRRPDTDTLTRGHSYMEAHRHTGTQTQGHTDAQTRRRADTQTQVRTHMQARTGTGAD
eukprot:7807282-Alexandrium_andersonii.AAC.1